MARFVDYINGILTQLTPISTSTGVSDSSKLVQTGASGKLSLSLMPAELTVQAKVFTASEDLSAGDLVNIWLDTATWKVRKAAASTSRRADGYVNAGFLTDADATVYTEGFNTQLTGLTPGLVWLGEAGAVTQTAPVSGSGGIAQIVGSALSATELEFEPNDQIALASS